MITLNLETKSREQELIKQYLEENVSQTLADKINNGVPAEKDGKPLISKKNLDGFFSFASEEARKLADKGARSACVEDKTVYGWAIHYFEEDSIIGNLYYIDGTEYKPAPKTKPKAETASVKPKPEKKNDSQFSLFDMMEENDKKQLENAIKGQVITEDGEIIEYEDFDGDVDEVAEQEPIVENKPQGSPLYQRYKRIQDAYPTSVITMRLGDFYEFFGDMAAIVANELDLTLAGRDCGLSEMVPMCGIPYHAAERYFEKINAIHDLVIVESDKDADTRYLPKNQPKTGEFATIKNELTEKLIALFGADLEVII